MARKSEAVRWQSLDAAPTLRKSGNGVELAKDTTAQPNLFVVLLATFGVCALATVFTAALVLGELDDVPLGKWGAAVFIVPLNLLALLTIYNLFAQIVLAIRRKLGGVGVGQTRVQLSQHPLRPGDRCRLRVSQSGDLTLRSLRVLLVCDVKEPEPSDKVNALPNPSKRVFVQELAAEPAIRVTPERPYEFTCELTIPNDGVCSVNPYFVPEEEEDIDEADEAETSDSETSRIVPEVTAVVAGDFAAGDSQSSCDTEPAHPFAGQEVTWKILVQGDIPAWPDFERAFRLVVESRG